MERIRSGRASRIRLRVTAASLGVLMGLMLSEIAIRVAAPQSPSWLDVFQRKDSAPAYGLQANVSRRITTGETHWTVYTDAASFRRGASPDSNPGPVLLVLGDSFAFGMAVDYEQSFPGLLEQRLRGRYRVLNAGVPGYGPTQYRQVLEQFLATRPAPAAVLVATYTGNDFHDCIWNKNTPVRDGILGGDISPRGFAKRHLHLYRLLSQIYHAAHQPDPQEWPYHAEMYRQQSWETGNLRRADELFEREFERIAELCRARQIPALACIIPTPKSVEASGRLPTTTTPTTTTAPAKMPRYELPTLHARAALEVADLRFVDLTAPLARAGAKASYFAWDQHLNATGHRVAADAISEAINAPEPPAAQHADSRR